MLCFESPSASSCANETLHNLFDASTPAAVVSFSPIVAPEAFQIGAIIKLKTHFYRYQFPRLSTHKVFALALQGLNHK